MVEKKSFGQKCVIIVIIFSHLFPSNSQRFLIVIEIILFQNRTKHVSPIAINTWLQWHYVKHMFFIETQQVTKCQF